MKTGIKEQPKAMENDWVTYDAHGTRSRKKATSMKGGEVCGSVGPGDDQLGHQGLLCPKTLNFKSPSPEKREL